MMTRYQFDRERLLTELSDFGVGFQQGKPYVPPPKKRGWLFILAVNLLAAGFFMSVMLAVVGLWAHFA